MRGKVGLVIGLAAGYVLGSRAGRERYEQIKAQTDKVWNLDGVQKQVDKAKDLAADAAKAVPGALWDGANKVTRAVTQKGSAGEKLDAAVDAGKESSAEVKKAAANARKDAEKVADAAEQAADEAAKAAEKAERSSSGEN
ncbi:hypothetical protein M4I32_06320 [Microbacterium sp. LRZ72]|uniref:hypothetical protein n=1 Tax=Microbacterium sp. LRZ72 TaxID=2942481 RepID=UPI0029A93B90|nr:hypothetical protein [Microbacterium sp. LRZ72]MDX2376411.1 hypothetical protein [Microbacterium sp. LRZ72]